jgi:hypothetical protein
VTSFLHRPPARSFVSQATASLRTMAPQQAVSREQNMHPPQRRRSDAARAAPAGPIDPVETPRDADGWLARCVARMREIDPTLSADEADEVARTMLAFERTRLMAPEAAVDFVVAELVKPTTRFERRNVPRRTRH